ncbi:MAG: BREX-1 system phosphatase PglZ type A [Aridibacter sp.]
MNISEITETLEKFFGVENYRVVLWNDAESEFLENIKEIVPARVELVRLDKIGGLAAKVKIELEEPLQKFLVYSPTIQPEAKDDWLLDVRLYSHNFTADAASLLLNELGLKKQSLREYIGEHKTFFASNDRRERLKQWLLAEDAEKEIGKKMLAITANAKQPETFSIFLQIFADLITEFEDSAENNLDNFSPSVWKNIEKFGLADNFWTLAKETFGYASEKPKLYDLLVRLFVTDFAGNANIELPQNIQPLKFASRSDAINAKVFLANWRSNTAYLEHYRKISTAIENEIDAENWLSEIPVRNLSECETFEAVERRIISGLRDRLLSELPADITDWQNLIYARRDKFWCSSSSGKSYLEVYKALLAALDFYSLRRKYEKGFSFSSAAEALNSYTDEIFLFDKYYRLFSESAHQVKFEGWNVLKPLTEGIENAYGNWFLENLAVAWGKCVEHENLFEKWEIENVSNQYNFYKQNVKPITDRNADTKVYVLISDAFRYECAEELTNELNAEARSSGNALLEAELSAQLGVVPSYTGLGMASLLPHTTLDYKELNPNADILYTDGKSTSGFNNRTAVLNNFNGTAIKSDDLMDMNTASGRDFVKDFQVIYVYHNVIDATGDTASTESDTFDAVRKTINELSRIVNFIFNSLNGSRIFITADHGFLFQLEPPAAIDKSSLDIRSDEVLKKKKRYVINPKIEPVANGWHGNIRNTAGIAGDMEFLIPKGANRFHFTGGARFVHGGAMPQEICVPVIALKKLRGKAAKRSKVKKVGVTLLKNLTRIVNNVQKLDFIQTDAVSERVLPRTLSISLRDENDKLISNTATVTFESTSDSMDDRRKSVQLVLRSGDYDRKKSYSLLIEDKDAVVKEYQRIPVIIDIAFSSDF